MVSGKIMQQIVIPEKPEIFLKHDSTLAAMMTFKHCTEILQKNTQTLILCKEQTILENNRHRTFFCQ